MDTFRLLADGELPFHRTDEHHRMRFADLIQLKEGRERTSVRAMAEVSHLAQELGMVWANRGIHLLLPLVKPASCIPRCCRTHRCGWACRLRMRWSPHVCEKKRNILQNGADRLEQSGARQSRQIGTVNATGSGLQTASSVLCTRSNAPKSKSPEGSACQFP